ncbi:primosomal replication protein N [Formivibrio citricus]|uniref:primosomal replication protein N n=1 Tax=Formivibrio citricus TaxID=83765 RepID=UPI001FDF86E2|nr:primosomal replication protein N [Formivibrio citricus]
MDNCNQVRLTGTLLATGPLRHTPAGLPILETVIVHQSEQQEAGRPRKVDCEAPILAMGETALALHRSPPGARMTVKGFLAARSLRRKQDLVLHIEEFELLN